MKSNHLATSAAGTSPLDDASVMVELIAQVTGRPSDEVAHALRAEYEQPGITVAKEFRRRELTPYVLTEGLERFYSESDAFIFESAVWNRNRVKSAMRRWIGQHLDKLRSACGGQPLDVLCIGDGLGFDSVSFASRGHSVTYHEVPGPHEAFARAVFERAGQDVRVVTQQSELQDETFDVVVCLDVLEHVPELDGFIAQLVSRLRPEGRLIVHAPFYMIHAAYPTHLKCNRVHSGSLRLYMKHGLRLVDGRLFWNPLVLQRTGQGETPTPPAWVRRVMSSVTGSYLAIGRWTTLPLRPIHLYRRVRGRWFG